MERALFRHSVFFSIKSPEQWQGERADVVSVLQSHPDKSSRPGKDREENGNTRAACLEDEKLGKKVSTGEEVRKNRELV